MAAEGRRGTAKIDRNVENSAPHDAHQLVLSERGLLEMQAANRPDTPRHQMILLHEIERKSGCLEIATPVDLGQEAALIGDLGWREQFDRGDGCRSDVNGHSEAASTPLAQEGRAYSSPDRVLAQLRLDRLDHALLLGVFEIGMHRQADDLARETFAHRQ